MTYRRDIAVLIVLLASSRNSEVKDNEPGYADLCPHFEINPSNAWVQTGTHEDVVNKAARHSHRVPGEDGPEIHAKRYGKAIDDCNRHKMAIIVDDFSEAEDTRYVEDRRRDQGDVERDVAVTVVHQCFVPKRGNWEALLLISRDNLGKEKLEEEVAGVHLPRVESRAGILAED